MKLLAAGGSSTGCFARWRVLSNLHAASALATRCSFAMRRGYHGPLARKVSLGATLSDEGIVLYISKVLAARAPQAVSVSSLDGSSAC
eukprot:6207466-Pleurochrysis_carterae.AAC.6